MKVTKDTQLITIFRALDRKRKRREREGWKFGQKPIEWIDEVVRPIGDTLLPLIEGAKRVGVTGPSGIRSVVWLSFYRSEEDDCLAEHHAIAVCPDFEGGFALRIINYHEDTGEYDRGTIGEINGCNHPSIEIPKDATVEWLLQHVERIPASR